MNDRADSPNEPLLIRLLGSAGGIAACVAGTLYLAGIATLAIRMWNAGLTAEDYVPLFSLDQLLRTGLTWVSPAIPELFFLAALLLVSIILEHDLGRQTRIFENERAKQIEDGEKRAAWVALFGPLRKRTDWPAVIKHLSSAIADSADASTIKHWRQLRLRLWLFQWAWINFVALVLFTSTFFLVTPVAVITYVAIMIISALVGTRPSEQNLAPLIIVVILGFLVNAITNPRPLPRAIVITRSTPARHSGDFVGSADGAWYLGQGHGRVLVIREVDIVCSSLQSQPRADPLWRVVLDDPQKQPKLVNPDCRLD